MEEFLKQLGAVLAVFFLVSLAVETILESLRGVLAAVGIETLKSKKSLEEAMDEVAEFLPGDQKDVARFEALVSIVEKTTGQVKAVSDKIAEIRRDLITAVDRDGKLKVVDREKEWLADLSAPIRKMMEAKESNRIFALRIISAGIGVAIALIAKINVIALMMPPGSEAQPPSLLLACLIVGLAAAGGSSFWHDQLDRVRSLKQAGESVASLTATVRKP